MSTPTSQMPTEPSALQNTLHTLGAKLMAHSQTVNELMSANLELRAAVHYFQTEKAKLEAYVQSLVNPPAAPEATAPADATAASAVDASVEAPATDAPAADANSVSA